MDSKFNILTDDAEQEDLLENKAHENIANHLYGFITDTNSHGLTVGIEGKWGSGKSTVIKILNEKLKKSKDIFVFYIDTWAHEGDPLRRIFLESFISRIEKTDQFRKLDSKGKEELNNIKGKIQYKQKTTLISKMPEIDTAGKVTTALAFLVPLGTVLVESTFPDVTIKWGLSPHWVFLLGLLLVVAPFLSFLLFSCLKKSFFKNKDCDTIKETSNEEEKSSVDFDLYFTNLQDFLSRKLNITKIVCIIDNLDRVRENDALKIWSTLQIFVQGKNSNINNNGQDEKLKFWVLVPYDEQRLRKLWDNGNIKKDDKESLCSKSVFDKSFQLRICVPQLIIGDWEDFAKTQIERALSHYEKNEKEIILDVLKWTRKDLNDSPTPREIKMYINQIGFLYPLNKQYISLASVCYYIVLKYLYSKSSDEIKDGLVAGSIPDQSMELYQYKQELTSELSSLIFMIPKEKALQLLLQKPIQKGLDNDGDYLMKLKNKHKQVFYTVLENILIKGKDLNIQTTIITLYKTFYEKDEDIITILTRYINSSPVKSDIFAHIENYSTECWEIIIKLNINDNSFIDKINRTIPHAVDEQINKKNNEKVFVPILETIITTLDDKCAIQIKYNDLTFSGFEKIYSQIGNNTSHIAKCFDNIKHFDEDVSAQLDLVPFESAKSISENLPALIDIQLQTGKEISWENTFSSIERCLATDLNKNNCIIILQILEKLQKCTHTNTVIDTVKQILKSGHFWNNVYAVNTTEKNIATYLLAKYTDNVETFSVPQINYAPNVFHTARNALRTRDPELANYFYKLSSYTDDYKFIWRLSENSTYKLVGDIIIFATEKQTDNFFNQKNPYKLLINAFNLVEEKYYPDIVTCFITLGNLEKSLTNDETFEFIKNPIATLLILKSTQNEEVFKSIITELCNCSEEQWNNIFTSHLEVLDIIAYLVSNQKSINFTNGFYKAYFNHLFNTSQRREIEISKLVAPYFAMKKEFQEEFTLQVEMKLLESKFNVSDIIQKVCIELIRCKYLTSEKKTDFSDLIKTKIEAKEESSLKFIVKLIENAQIKYLPDSHYSEVLKESIRNLADNELKSKLADIFRVNLTDGKQV